MVGCMPRLLQTFILIFVLLLFLCVSEMFGSSAMSSTHVRNVCLGSSPALPRSRPGCLLMEMKVPVALWSYWPCSPLCPHWCSSLYNFSLACRHILLHWHLTWQHSQQWGKQAVAPTLCSVSYELYCNRRFRWHNVCMLHHLTEKYILKQHQLQKW